MPEKTETDLGENPAVEVAKENEAETDGILTLSTGVRVLLHSVSGILVQEVVLRIKDPRVPMVLNEDKGREEENPLDPDYVAALAEAERQRSQASVDAVVMFGVELVDGLPEDDLWIKKLKRLGIEFDAEDKFEREFAYKKYIAVGAPDLDIMIRTAGVTEEGIRQAAATFPGSEEGESDRGGGDQGRSESPDQL